MNITPDQIHILEYGFFKINGTILFTWLVMLFLALCSWLITRKIKNGMAHSRFEVALEIIVEFIYMHLQEIGLRKPEKYIGIIGTLFIFIATSGILSIIPGYTPPTASLSTTAALAICVFISVPVYGIKEKGLIGYLKNYTRPSVFMLPFNLIGDCTRTIALAVRLFGNTMSGALLIGIIVSLAPFFFPILLNILGLITSLIQAYIFTVLATVYLGAATRIEEEKNTKSEGV